METKEPLFRKVLIANRGEIACRVIKTLDVLGIDSVAIHHASERGARHVRLAREAFEITGETPVAAHLDAAQIITLARQCGADAVHPGYGFLSEKAAFAAAVTAAGMTFIGPTPEAMELMGDKIRSRQFAAENDVPVAASVLPTDDIDTFLEEAASIGYPLLIKASAGGGGKGMSIVRHPDELASRARLASSEAARYFADGRVYAERYIERPRHIEVQVFGDGNGGAIHLHERECSVQRRFQKIVEEAPAADLPETVRSQLLAAAVRLASAARYLNAGTVEFILAPDLRFYFLEMNTRLQVEHPVTEMVTGLDLVRLQLEVAAGHALPQQDAITLNGHAIECRICAEDADRDFMPQTGKILALAEPQGANLRFENGLELGQSVTVSFDSMLAKLVAHGANRDAATDRLVAALRETSILGVGTNIDYLARLVDHRAFRKGALHTGFIEEHASALTPPPLSQLERDGVALAGALALKDFRTMVYCVPQPYAAMGGWRN